MKNIRNDLAETSCGKNCYLHFSNRVLRMTEGINDLGGISWELVLALLGSWTIVCLAAIKGIHTAGKVSHWMVIFCGRIKRSSSNLFLKIDVPCLKRTFIV